MTASALSRSRSTRSAPLTLRGRRGSARSGEEIEGRSDFTPGPRTQLLRAALVLICVVSVTLLIQLVVVSSLQERSAQGRAYDTFRARLAAGTAPIGPTDDAGHVLAAGTSVAYLEIPAIGVKEVVGQGTSPGVLFNGPGHRRDTPLPGQVGSSVIFGRRAAFGGPFADIGKLDAGDVIRATTGQGVFTFHVIGVIEDGELAPPSPVAGTARLSLVTAAGPAFLPNGVRRVYADLDGQAAVGPAPLISSAQLPEAERVMSHDSRTLWMLGFWLQVLIGLSIGVVWAWHRWGRAQTWIVFLPPLFLVGLWASGQAARLLPNLL